jgi:hypothetical protein
LRAKNGSFSDAVRATEMEKSSAMGGDVDAWLKNKVQKELKKNMQTTVVT